jgi:hypothetical protein
MDDSINATLPAAIYKSYAYTVLTSNVQYACFDFVAYNYYNSTTLFNAHGYASISMLTVSVPEPSSWATLLIGFTGLGFAGYSRTGRSAAKA